MNQKMRVIRKKKLTSRQRIMHTAHAFSLSAVCVCGGAVDGGVPLLAQVFEEAMRLRSSTLAEDYALSKDSSAEA